MPKYVSLAILAPPVLFHNDDLETASTMKILIVEDNPQMRSMLRLWLHDLATDFAECADGAEALDAYRNFLPDWVLMDWEMKIVDGLAATREIIAAYPNAKILMLTLHDLARLREAARSAGASGFVLKDELPTLRRMIAK